MIDPVLGYSTFLGSNHNDTPFGIAVDSAGSAYVTGTTNSTTFPGVGAGSIQPTPPIVFPAGFNGFVTKLNPQGTAVVYSTYLNGDGTSTSGQTIAVDAAGNAVVVGMTNSTTFPGTGASSAQAMSAGGSDAFVTKLNASGSAILFSTFLGGTAADNGTGVALDSAGSIYVTGSTGSSSFTGVGPGSLQPTNTTTSFLTKLTAAGAVVYSMFLGGTDVAVDGAGAAYITGGTNNPSFPGVGPGSIQPTFASTGARPRRTRSSPRSTRPGARSSTRPTSARPTSTPDPGSRWTRPERRTCSASLGARPACRASARARSRAPTAAARPTRSWRR